MKTLIISLVLFTGCATTPASLQPARTPSSQNSTITFVPGYSATGEGYKQAVQNLLSDSSVTQSVDVIQFNFDAASAQNPFVSSLAERLTALAEEGRTVRVFIENGGFGVGPVNHAGGSSLGPKVQVYYLQGLANHTDPNSPGILHSKVVIVDGHLILAGSTNWSDRSISANPSASRPANNEADLLIDSAPLGAAITAYANMLKSQAGVFPAKSLITRSTLSGPGMGSLSMTGVQLLLDTDYFPALLNFIGNTQNGDSLDCSMYTLGAGDHSDPSFPNGQGDQILASLLSALDRGVQLKILFDNDSFNRYGSQLNHNAAVALSKKTKDIYLTDPNVITHQKFCVVTSKSGAHSALIGSSNWDYVDLSLNHQVNWLVSDDKAALDILNYFNGLILARQQFNGM